MKKPAIISGIASCMIFTLLVFNACQPPAQEEAEQAREAQGGIALGGNLQVNESQKPASLYPASINDRHSSHLATQIYDGLLKYNAENLELAPNLAANWTVDETETVYTFELKKGVMFHTDECFGKEGKELTASDVQYSFELLCKAGDDNKNFEGTFKGKVKGAEEYNAGSASGISGIKVVDDYTVEISLVKADKSFLYNLAHPATAILAKEAIDKYGKDAKIGTGPFAYGEEGGKVVLSRNTKYHRNDAYGNQLPYLDKVTVSFEPNKDAELEAFFNGSQDIVTGLNLDPVKTIMEERINDFEGNNAKYVLVNASEIAGYDSYTLYRKSVKGFSDNFMNYHDYSVVQKAE